MDEREILKFCFEKGVLLDKEILDLFKEIPDFESVKLIIEKVKMQSNQRMITKSVFFENKNKLEDFFLGLPEENQNRIHKLKINLGVSIEISKEVSIPQKESLLQKNFESERGVKVVSNFKFFNKKLSVEDFVKYFRSRFFEIKNFYKKGRN